MTTVDDRVAIPEDEAGYAKYSDVKHNSTAPKSPTHVKFERVYTTPGVHPFDEIEWEKRDIVMTNWRDGSINFEQRGVEFPKSWSVNAANIVTTKYFRGNIGQDGRESSLKQLINRVVQTYRKSGEEWGYFGTPEDAEIFEHELAYMLAHQIFSFNSPVWFNVGWAGRAQQVSACFILAVEDTMSSILNWYKEEGLIFKGGSGAGLNLSRVRSTKETLSSGGTPSGPVSFMRGADSSAGTISSGGATRRAAKMVVLDVDHPDIEEFVDTKVREEDKIRALKAAGFDMELGGRDIVSVQYQNANNSVRVSDKFMEAVESGSPFDLVARTDGRTIETVNARELFDKIVKAAWACADPGLQYDDTINDWHTNPEDGRITASNPCSEYMSLDNSSCNLASINLMKFLGDDGVFDIERYVKVIEYVITAMDISICFADFPTEKIGRNTRRFRQLGIGYANLGALLMASGLAYDSEEGRAMAAGLTSVLTGVSYRRSAELAGVVGPYEGYAKNAAAHAAVMAKHAEASTQIEAPTKLGFALSKITKLSAPVIAVAQKEWRKGNEIGAKNGWRNAQASVLAPTGTIGLMMDCDTTGVEPDLALVKFKKLVGGASMEIVNGQVPRALKALGYQDETIEAIAAYIAEKIGEGDKKHARGHVIGAPGLREEHYSVFDCAMGTRAISWHGHVYMMAAIQPFISGSISKTVNLPESATEQEIWDAYFDGWKLGLKAIAVYRDKCKVGQPLDVAGADSKAKTEVKVIEVQQPVRRKLPKVREGSTRSVDVAGLDVYLTTNRYPDTGECGEIFIKTAKQGSTLSGLFDAFAVEFSMGRQYHVPLEAILGKYIGMSFEPAGRTDDPDIPMVKSVMDYIGRRLALDFLPFEVRSQLNVYTTEERIRYNNTGSYLPEEGAEGELATTPVVVAPIAYQPGKPEGSVGGIFENITAPDAPLCMTCGVKMRPAGACFVCENCGSTSGCS